MKVGSLPQDTQVDEASAAEMDDHFITITDKDDQTHRMITREGEAIRLIGKILVAKQEEGREKLSTTKVVDMAVVVRNIRVEKMSAIAVMMINDP